MDSKKQYVSVHTIRIGTFDNTINGETLRIVIKIPHDVKNKNKLRWHYKLLFFILFFRFTVPCSFSDTYISLKFIAQIKDHMNQIYIHL